MSTQAEADRGNVLSVDGTPPAESNPADAPAQPKSALPPIPDDALILLPVRGNVLFPGTIIPLHIDRAELQAGVQESVRLERPLGVVLLRKPDGSEPGPGNLHAIGTSAAVMRYLTAPDDKFPMENQKKSNARG